MHADHVLVGSTDVCGHELQYDAVLALATAGVELAGRQLCTCMHYCITAHMKLHTELGEGNGLDRHLACNACQCYNSSGVGRVCNLGPGKPLRGSRASWWHMHAQTRPASTVVRECSERMQ